MLTAREQTSFESGEQTGAHERRFTTPGWSGDQDEISVLHSPLQICHQILPAEEAVGVFFLERFEPHIRAFPIEWLGLKGSAYFCEQSKDILAAVTDCYCAGYLPNLNPDDLSGMDLADLLLNDNLS
jgi:hypothetical protein